jgi:hypothetical protein
MTLEVVNSVDMQEEIFVFQRSLPTAQANTVTEPTDFFISVADPVDLEDYPVNAPELEREMPFFLVKTLVLQFRSLVVLDETWEYIQEDIQGLVRALNTGLTEPQTETVTFE